MRRRISQGLLDFRDFLKRNRLKVVFAILFALAGTVLAIALAFTRGGIPQEQVLRNSVFLLITGRRSSWGYFFFRLLSLSAMLFVIMLLSMRPRLSYLSFLIVGFFAYNTIFFICAAFLFKSIMILPLMLICVLPIYIILCTLFIFYSVSRIDISRSIKVCSLRDLGYFFRHSLKSFLLILALIFLLVIIETILIGVLGISVVV